MFSGLTPVIASFSNASSTNGYRALIAKLPAFKMTLTDAWVAVTTTFTTATTTTYGLFRILNGGTTGNVTTRALAKGGASGGTWTAFTWRNITTNYTYSAGETVALRYSEQGTVALGEFYVTVHLVAGNV